MLWTADIDVPANGGIDIAPVAYGDRVYFSTVPVNARSGYAGAATGILYALDQATGDVLWEFDTVDTEDIWGDAERNSGGGTWYPPSIRQRSIRGPKAKKMIPARTAR